MDEKIAAALAASSSASKMMAAALPGLGVAFVIGAYFFIVLDRQRANSPSKDDTQVGLKLVLFGVMYAGLALAMVIAVIKATLVVLFFMHLKYDKLFHTVVFVSAILAAALFVGFTLMDSGQYQHTNIWDPDNPPLAPVGPRPTAG